MTQFILASQSPRRKKLLEQLGFSFKAITSNVDENIAIENPIEFVETLAFRKADDVANSNSNILVIGADTVVVLGSKILGKPQNFDEAVTMLKSLSGREHSVFTGVSFVIRSVHSQDLKTLTFSEETKVKFGTLSDYEIKQYVRSGSPMDKAGAYGIQDDWGAVFVESIQGDYYNVVGLPLHRLYKELKNFEPAVIEQKNKVL